MSVVYYVDFTNKKLVSKSTVETEINLDDQSSVEKLDYFASLVPKGIVSVYVNCKKAGVKLPASLLDLATTVLNFSTKYKHGDLAYSKEGVSSTLTFKGSPFFVCLPWSAVFAISLDSSPNSTRTWITESAGEQ